MPGYLSYAEQSAHYFAREHSGMPEGSVRAPGHWKATDFGSGESWRFRLSENHIEELEAAVATALQKGKSAGAAKLLEFGNQAVTSPDPAGGPSPRQAESASIRARGGRS